MPRKPKDLGAWERWLFDIAAQAAEKRDIQPLPMPDRKAATAARHKFHMFRIALADHRHPHFEAANDLIVRITNLAGAGELGRYVLEFVPLGLAIAADESRGSMRGIPSPLREQLPGVDELLKQADQEKAANEQNQREREAPDAHEALFEDMLKKPK